jgi:ATP synthase protein I
MAEQNDQRRRDDSQESPRQERPAQTPAEPSDPPEHRQPHPHRPPEQRFRDSVGRKAARKQRAREDEDRSIFFWLGMFGMVGWAVAIPTLAGVALGLWLDSAWPAAEASWTLTFLLLGVALGVLNAWYWVKRESGE